MTFDLEGQKPSDMSKRSVQSDITVDCGESIVCGSLRCDCKKVKLFSLITHIINTVMIAIILFREFSK